KEGLPKTPVFPVRDCNFVLYKDPEKTTRPILPAYVDVGRSPFAKGPSGGSFSGRSPSQPGGANAGPWNRTGACTDRNGRLLMMVVIPNVDFKPFTRCMAKICPPGSQSVLLDGGASTQIV